MKSIILIFLCNIILFPNAQTIKKGILLSTKDNSPVIFATIKCNKNAAGTYTNEKGEFEISVQSLDSVFITSIGYKQVKLSAVSMQDTIRLDEITTALTPITIEAKKFIAAVTLGNTSKKEEINWGPSKADDEFAYRINLTNQNENTVKLKSISFKIHRFAGSTPILLHIYDNNKNTNMPGDNLLLSKYIISKENYKKGKFIIDISKENIITTDSVFYVSLEWLGSSQKDNPNFSPLTETAISMCHSTNEKLTFSRIFKDGKNLWYPLQTKDNKSNVIKFMSMIVSVDLELYK